MEGLQKLKHPRFGAKMNPQSLSHSSPSPTDPVRYKTFIRLISKPNSHIKGSSGTLPHSTNNYLPFSPSPVQWPCRVSAINTPEAGDSTTLSFKPSSNTNPHPWYILAACIYSKVMHKPFALMAFLLSPAQWVSWDFLALLILIPITTWTLLLDSRQRRCLPQHLWCEPPSQRGFFISEIEAMPEDRQES